MFLAGLNIMAGSEEFFAFAGSMPYRFFHSNNHNFEKHDIIPSLPILTVIIITNI